ncbi:hypothetical protein BLOT_016806 [Blomia tropicalis]|nr:hypothetical protein BLOT_016806 [Blomia tropicalis]
MTSVLLNYSSRKTLEVLRAIIVRNCRCSSKSRHPELQSTQRKNQNRLGESKVIVNYQDLNMSNGMLCSTRIDASQKLIGTFKIMFSYWTGTIDMKINYGNDFYIGKIKFPSGQIKTNDTLLSNASFKALIMKFLYMVSCIRRHIGYALYNQFIEFVKIISL